MFFEWKELFKDSNHKFSGVNVRFKYVKKKSKFYKIIDTSD